MVVEALHGAIDCLHILDLAVHDVLDLLLQDALLLRNLVAVVHLQLEVGVGECFLGSDARIGIAVDHPQQQTHF